MLPYEKIFEIEVFPEEHQLPDIGSRSWQPLRAMDIYQRLKMRPEHSKKLTNDQLLSAAFLGCDLKYRTPPSPKN
ncbi:hypothetical protein DMENIID0001_040980 [Sergentomyia squamirostris]